MDERSEQDAVTGVLRIRVGGSVRLLRTLKARWVEDWIRLFTASGRGEPKPFGEWDERDVAELGAGTVGRTVDLLVAYDREGALGGREWLLDNADPSELHAALVEVVANVFPLADGPAFLAGLMLARAAAPAAPEDAPSGPPSSTSSASTSGASTRTPSGRGSTRSS